MIRGESLRNFYVERQIFLSRLLFSTIAGALLCAVLLSRLIQLQVFEHQEFSTRSEENRVRLFVIPPVRGTIYDRNGVVLAENGPAFMLEINAEKTGDLEDTLERVSKRVRLNDNDLARFRERRRKALRYADVPLRFNLTPEELANFEVSRYDFPGVEVEPSLNRRYPLGPSASHVLGYIGGITDADLASVDETAYRGSNYFGKTGIEKTHEASLHGAPGSKVIEANAAGRPLRELEYRAGLPGNNLLLTLDAKVQLAAERALGDRNGAVVAIAPATGEVLALVSKPGFDPHLFLEGIDAPTYKALNEDPKRPLFNRALNGQYAPGSTIKPFMALAGLDLRQLNANKSVFCKGSFSLPGVSRKYRCHKREGHGWVDLERAVAVSCDVYFYQAALEMGVDRIHDFLARFGLGRITGIDLPGEKSGLLPSTEWKRRVRKENWYAGETLSVGIGQGSFLVTPLQLAQITSRIALQGRGFRPHLVRAVQAPQGGGTVAVPPEALPRIALRDPAEWARIIATMEAVVMQPGGTAYGIGRTSPYRIAGKTGTVQVVAMRQDEVEARSLESTPEHLRDHALFVAFAPIDDPQIAVAVLAEHSGHGGSAAAPVARAVMDAFLLDDNGALR